MRWRIIVSVLLAILGAVGPTIVLLVTFGARATLKDLGDDPLVVAFVLALALVSTCLGLGAAALIRAEQWARILEMLVQSFRSIQQRHA